MKRKNPYVPGACWAGLTQHCEPRKGMPLEHCGLPALKYIIKRDQKFGRISTLRAEMYLCVPHRKRLERAGYTATIAN